MEDQERLLDYRTLAGRLAAAALVIGALTFVAIVVDGLQQGLSFRLMARWLGVAAPVFLLTGGGLAALHAVRGAQRARQRGERIGSRDVGLIPRRPDGSEDDD